MANVYYDFNLNWKNITPFVTAGIGVASHDASFTGGNGLPAASGRSTGFAYQAGAGIAYRVSPTLAFTGDYKYLTTSDIDIGSYRTGYHSHEVRIGLQYDLPVGFMN
jgi:opacity protein-like surface antigen